MPNESSTPDLVKLNRAFIEAANRGDVDASTGAVKLRQGFVSLVEGGLIQRVATYLDPDEARAAAERLVHERG
jgi:hypothetical protein